MKKKKSKKKVIKPALDYRGGFTYPPLANGVADPAGSYTGYPIIFDMPEQDADDL